MSVSVGIDLAAEPKGTAIATVQWSQGTATVTALAVGCDDAEVLAAMQTPRAVVGIDCPFGWPEKFVTFIQRHSDRSLRVPDELAAGWRREYARRSTDLWVSSTYRIEPLSVAADRIGHTALRLAAVMSRLDPQPALDGSSGVAEVYPAAALKVWGLRYRGYKGPDNADARNELVADLLQAAPWLDLGEHDSSVRVSDHALDAVVCALIARAVQLGHTTAPEDRPAALREGWIHVPTCGLAALCV